MMEEILFSAKQVNGKQKRKGFRENFVLRDINFELPAGYIMGIVGKNGAGKTTFFKYILEEKKMYEGQFLLDGRDILEDSVWTKDNIGFVSDDNHFILQRTAAQNAELLGLFYSSFDKDLFLQMMGQMGLSPAKTLGAMSRGEYIKFQLAFAIAHKPRLLLLDEATAGMDPVYRKDFYQWIRNLMDEERCSVIMSSHLEEDIQKQFDYIAYLEDGKFVSFQENEWT